MYHAAPGLYCRSGHWIDGRTARGADGVGERVDGDFARIAEFVLEIDKLKNVIRRTKPAALDRYENSAEHSWHVAMMALVLAEHADTDIDRFHVVKLLLVHDLVEIDAGDRLHVAEPLGQSSCFDDRFLHDGPFAFLSCGWHSGSRVNRSQMIPRHSSIAVSFNR